MGTEISLDVGGLTVSWSKNSRGPDHGALYQMEDRKRISSDYINYDDPQDDDELAAMEISFTKPLADMLPRLELLGFTLEQVEQEYRHSCGLCQEERDMLLGEGLREHNPELMNFAEFRDFISSHPLQSLDDKFVSGSDEKSERDVMGRFTDDALKNRIPHYSEYDQNGYSERSYFAGLIGFLHPYSLLRLLAEAEPNGGEAVVWNYGPLVSNGWAQETEFNPGTRRADTFLIATEGSSDAHILNHAIALLRPEIADFFSFIDMSECHPFPGAGNLVKFAEGLAKIDVHNQVVFLLDNDAEGRDALARFSKLSLPNNMRAIMLPDLDVFKSFPSRGPEGPHITDINGRAAAIECYLDLEAKGLPLPEVMWTNYRKNLEIYQGALQHKQVYMKRFLKQTPDSLCENGYKTQKITAILDRLYSECSSIASDQALPD